MDSAVLDTLQNACGASSEGAEEYSPGREPRVAAWEDQAPKERQKLASGTLVEPSHHSPPTDDPRPTTQSQLDTMEPQPLQGRTSLAQHGSAGERASNDPESRRDGTIALRLGLRYVKGLHEEAGQAIVRERSKAPFDSIDDLARRVPELNKKELNTLAEIGALNSVSSFEFQVSNSNTGNSKLETRNSPFHRRDALWSASAAANRFGPLLENVAEPDHASPLKKMTDEERLVADFRGTGLTTGPHPMSYHRARMNKMGVRRAIELANLTSGRRVRVAGGVIARQRPGTAKGFVFLSLEDETGVANAIINPDLFQKNRLLLATEQFLLIEGILQNQDGVISVKAVRVAPLNITRVQTSSHDFH
jgi:error-prone DNA polymerase